VILNSIWISDPPEVTAEREWVHTGHGAKSELTCFVEAEPDAKVCTTQIIANYINSNLFLFLLKIIFILIELQLLGNLAEA